MVIPSEQGKIFYGWKIVFLGFGAMAFGGGIWSGFGVFFETLLDEFGGSRAGLSLVITFGMIFWAIGAFMAGTLVNRFGPKKLILFGVGLMGLGCFLSSATTSTITLFTTYGLLIAMGTGFSTMNTNSVLISRWFVRKRGTALGVSTSGYNAGQLILIPFTALLIGNYGWRWAFIIWGMMFWFLLGPILFKYLKNSPEEVGLAPDNEPPGEVDFVEPIETRVRWIPRGTVLRAMKTRSFWLLFASYVGCGFTDFVMYVHFPIFATGIGVNSQTAANAFGLIGGLAIIGVIGLGAWADKIGYKIPLVLIYATRCIGILLLATTGSVVMLFIAVAIYGLAHQASTPLTPGMAAHLYGRSSLGNLYGYLLLGHSIGALSGPFVAGLTFDVTGSYRFAFFLTAAILAASSACCACINPKPNY